MKTDFDYHFFFSFDGGGENIRTKLSLLKVLLEKNDIEVFYDNDHDDVFFGEKIKKIIKKEIKSSQFFLSFFQPNIGKNKGERETRREQELEFAIKFAEVMENESFIQPVIIGETNKDKILSYLELQNKYFIDKDIGFRTYKDFNEKDIEELSKILIKKVSENFEKSIKPRVFSNDFKDIKISKGQTIIPLTIDEIRNFPSISLNELRTYIYSVHKHNKTFTDFDIQLQLEAIEK